MQIKQKKQLAYSLLLIACVVMLLSHFLPWLFSKTVLWQKEFNQLIAFHFRQINNQPFIAGGYLVLVSFLYGFFHAIGPGHGKFIIVSYLSTHPSKFKKSIKLTLLSSLSQGMVAILLASIMLVILKLSSRYFQLSQLWLERISFFLIMLLGAMWVIKALKKLINAYKPANKLAKIQPIKRLAINSIDNQQIAEVGRNIASSQPTEHQHHENCGCHHQHVPNSQQLTDSSSFKSQLLVVLSIGLRPCTGAIFVLFFAYIANLYWWGIVATMVMSIGTGIALSALALFVQYARQSAVKISHSYLLPNWLKNIDAFAKLIAGIVLIFFAIALLYATNYATSSSVGSGMLLFNRSH